MKHIVQLFGLLFLLILSHSTWAQLRIPRLDQVDIQHYRFELALNDSSDVIYGKAAIDIRFLQDKETFYLDLVKEDKADGKGMKVQKVLVDSSDANFTHTGNLLWIKMKKPANAGDTRSFTIYYEGIPKDGLVISPNKFGDRTFFGDNWPNRARNWLPTIDHPSDKASVEFIIKAPSHYQVVATGKLLGEKDMGSDKQTHWKTNVPIPTKVMVIGVARFAIQESGVVNGIPVSSWVYPQNSEAGFGDYAPAVGILRFFIKKIGPYPYEKLANVQSRTRYGGTENASNIFYSENSVTGKNDQHALIAHEIAHQWFGNSASEGNWFHLWLSEGFATYMTDLYFEEEYGRDKMVERLISERERVNTYAGRRFRPIIDTTIQDYNDLLNPNSYQKGAWVLHMLRKEIGDKAFWKGIRNYYEAYKDGNALSADFQKVMEKAGKKKLDTFFEQWLHQAGHPSLAVKWEPMGNKKVKISVEQLQKNAVFEFPLDVAIENDRGKGLVVKTIRVKDKQSEFVIKSKGLAQGVTIDPACWLLYRGEVERARVRELGE